MQLLLVQAQEGLATPRLCWQQNQLRFGQQAPSEPTLIKTHQDPSRCCYKPSTTSVLFIRQAFLRP